MNNKLTATLIVVFVSVAGCSKSDSGPSAAPESAAQTGTQVKRGGNGEIFVMLDSATREIMGLEIAELKPVTVAPRLKATGNVLNPSPLTALVAELMTAEAASRTAAAELARLKTLAAQSNASQRALEAAETAATQEAMRVESTRLRLSSEWGTAMAERDDLANFTASLSRLESALVELSVPAAEQVSQIPSSADFVTIADPAKPIHAVLLGPAPSVDPQFQRRGFRFVVRENRGRLAPGAAVNGYLNLPGEPRPGTELPQTAVFRHVGADWVYVQRSEGTYERVMVQLQEPLEGGWFIPSGAQAQVRPSDKVVVAGAQQLLSEELKGQLGE